MNSLQISNLCFSVREQRILDGVSFNVEAGETVGIIGPNGSGKTTLFNAISGFCQIQKGTIVFKGQALHPLPAYRRAQCGVGRVFQNVGVFKEMSVMENMLTALEGRAGNSFGSNFGVSSKLVEQALQFLARVNLSEAASKKAASLSGGQLRLLEIVRCLAFGAELFLLDEPTAGVSPKMKDDVAGLIMELKQLGKTILVIEHDLNFIQKFCARIVVLEQGKVLIDGTPEAVRGNPKLQEIYFGSKAAQPSHL